MMILDKLLLIILIYTTLTANSLVSNTKDNTNGNYKFTSIGLVKKYSPLIETNIKIGNKRHLGRLGALLPILQNDINLIYASYFVMKDTKSAFENNIGLGYRRIKDNTWIIGGYGFWDIRRSINKKNYIHQLNIGLEVFRERVELRLNGYLPVSKDVLINKLYTDIDSSYFPSINQTIQSQTDLENHEVLLPGYDIEFGGSITSLINLNLYAAYFHFFKDNISQIGYRIRTDYNLFDWLSLGGEISYDNVREWYNYFDLRVQYRFGKENKFRRLTKIEQKMTLLPVRDIDIISKVQKKKILVHKNNEQGVIPVIVIATTEQLYNKKIRITGDTVIYLYHTNVRSRFNQICKKELQNFIIVNSNGKWNKLIKGSKINEEIALRFSKFIQNNKLMILAIKTKNESMKKYLDDEISKALNGVGYLFDKEGKVLYKNKTKPKPRGITTQPSSNHDLENHTEQSENEGSEQDIQLRTVLNQHLRNRPSLSELISRGIIEDINDEENFSYVDDDSSESSILSRNARVGEVLRGHLITRPNISVLRARGIIINEEHAEVDDQIVPENSTGNGTIEVTKPLSSSDVFTREKSIQRNTGIELPSNRDYGETNSFILDEYINPDLHYKDSFEYDDLDERNTILEQEVDEDHYIPMFPMNNYGFLLRNSNPLERNFVEHSALQEDIYTSRRSYFFFNQNPHILDYSDLRNFTLIGQINRRCQDIRYRMLR